MKKAIILSIFIITSPSQTIVLADDFSYQEHEVRCCLTDDLVHEMIYLKISFPGHDRVGDLEVLTPDGGHIGYDKKTNLYYPANSSGLYALSNRTTDIYTRQWDFDRYLLIYRYFLTDALQKYHQIPGEMLVKNKVYSLGDGVYTIIVHGRVKGLYDLSLCEPGSTLEKCKSNSSIQNHLIDKGEEQYYSMDGKTLMIKQVN